MELWQLPFIYHVPVIVYASFTMHPSLGSKDNVQPSQKLLYFTQLHVPGPSLLQAVLPLLSITGTQLHVANTAATELSSIEPTLSDDFIVVFSLSFTNPTLAAASFLRPKKY